MKARYFRFLSEWFMLAQFSIADQGIINVLRRAHFGMIYCIKSERATSADVTLPLSYEGGDS